MRLRSKASLLVLPCVSALVLAGCGSGDSGSGGSGADATVSVNSSDPQNPLIPTNTQETGGGMIVDSMWSGLVKYNDDTAEPEDEVAQSITTKDSKVFDIKIKKGWKFHDGTEVKAHNFIDAWNYGSLVTNAQINADFFGDIAGFDKVHPSAKNAKPTAQTLSGLKQINDYEFQVTLTQPNSVFKTSLGYDAFYPMPDSFFKASNKEDWAKNPVGNGPFKWESYQPQVAAKVQRFDDFSGDNKAKVKGVDFKMYPSGGTDAAYQDLISGNLDFLEVMPSSALPGGKWKQDLQDRVLTPNLMTMTTLRFPDYSAKWKDPNLRHAMSMAVDRDSIVKNIFNGTRAPLDGWVPPAVPGAAKDACGEFCKFNPDKAKDLLKKSGFKGNFTITSNLDGGHKEWIEAVCNSINKTFEGMNVNCSFAPVPTFGVYRQQEVAKKIQGPYRDAWNFDYPSPDNALGALYDSNGAANFSDYSNKAFDAKLVEARKATDEQTANKLFGEADKMLADTMPGMPLWTETGTAGYSSNIKSVKFSTLKRLPDLTTIEAN